MKRLPGIFLLFIALYLPTVLLAQTEVELNGKGNQTHTYRSNTGVTSTDLEYRGKITFTEDERDVKYISPGGFLKFSKRSFGNKRTIELEGEANGVINRIYSEGSTKLPFDPEGKEWMASVLPEIIRTTGIGAEERVLKFYKKGGINAVLAEIDNLPSDYVQSKYYTAALNLNGLTNSDIKRVLSHANNELNSSYEQSKLLRENSELFARSEENMAAAIISVEDVNSSYEQGKIYQHFLKERNLSEANKALIIKGTREISSNYEQSKVLQALLQDDLSTKNIELVINEIPYLSSSYEQSNVLQYLIKNQETKDIDFDLIVKAISSINSSYEQGKVLGNLVTSRELSTNQIIAVAEAAQEISSDYEQSKLLQSLISEQRLDKTSIEAILSATDEVSSSYEKSKILTLIVSADSFDHSNIKSMLIYASEITSSYDQSKVLAQIADMDDLSDSNQLALLDAIDDLSSNYEKSKLLTRMAPKLSTNSDVHNKFLLVAKSLSDYDYGKLMKVMNY